MLLLSTATSSFAWWSSAARELHERGFATLPGRVDAHLVEHMRHARVAELEQQLVEVGAAGCDVLEHSDGEPHRQAMQFFARRGQQLPPDALNLYDALTATEPLRHRAALKKERKESKKRRRATPSTEHWKARARKGGGEVPGEAHRVGKGRMGVDEDVALLLPVDGGDVRGGARRPP